MEVFTSLTKDLGIYSNVRCSSDYKNDFINLREMIRIMRKYETELPIYYYSRRSERDFRLINLNAYLDVCDDIIKKLKKNF
ncbi:MAG: hypothetical protein K2H20_03810 [Bacilli bacterium]|nr:hypothetical protein [Bacilli bacterium]